MRGAKLSLRRLGLIRDHSLERSSFKGSDQHPTPGGFDEFVEKAVPILQERKVFRQDFAAPTLRGNLAPPEVWQPVAKAV